MGNKKIKCALISDSNTDIFSNYLNNDEQLPFIDATPAPFGQVKQILMENDSPYLSEEIDCAVIWTRPEAVIQSFNGLLHYTTVSIEDVLREVDQFASLILNCSGKVRSVFVPSWILPTYYRGYGMLDMKKNIGFSNVLMQMNMRLADHFDGSSNIFLLDTQRWVSVAGKNAFNPRLWFRGKIMFGNEVYREAVKDIKSALRGIAGTARKLIVLDLDNTLWGGVVGDLGWENIVLGGHDAIGESFVEFQHVLKSMLNRGILLGIVSKNEESVALDAINKNPEMVLQLKDFAGWRINWQDKADNIYDLVSDLNLGLQSVVFLDDNPVEQARVREALPEVFVPEWPEDPMMYKSALLSLRCFETPAISKEDMRRAEMYQSERKRKDMKKNFSLLDDWLKGLEMKVEIEELNDANLRRVTQLLNKTNQMNLATRRMTEPELTEWAGREGHILWAFRVSDKFGDSGLTGIISLKIEDGIGQIIDFVMSCRIIGRKVEETMLYTAIQYARSSGLQKLQAQYIPTPKNRPCLHFWKKSGFHYDETGNSFSWDLTKTYALPSQIEIIHKNTQD